MGKFPSPPKDRHRPPFAPVKPVDTAEDIKLQLMLETLKKDLAEELIKLLRLVHVDGDVIE